MVAMENRNSIFFYKIMVPLKLPDDRCVGL